MSAYAIGLLRSVQVGEEVLAYLQGIDATLSPFGGRFIIHGGLQQVLEAGSPGNVVVIEFPDLDAARGWYGSEAYQSILPLRMRNADGDVLLIEGVEAGYRATDVLTSG
jgi:uncharacterized protein (DUF1330 family)